MTRVLCVDPGSERSAWVLLEDGVPTRWKWYENAEAREVLRGSRDFAEVLAIEYVYLRGMKVFQQTLDTMYEAGRIAQAWGGPVAKINRLDVKMALCGDSRANDGNIRTAIIDSFGGPDVAIGGKRCQACKGKGWRGRGRKPCPDCIVKLPLEPGGKATFKIIEQDEKLIGVGSGLETPRGPLHAFAKDGSGGLGHRWQALACGLTWISQQGNG